MAAEGRFGEGHRQIEPDICAVAAEKGVRGDGDLDQRITWHAAFASCSSSPGASLAAQAQRGAVGGGGGNTHVQRSSIRQGEPGGRAVHGIEKRRGQAVAPILAMQGTRIAPPPALAEHGAEHAANVLLVLALRRVAIPGRTLGMVAIEAGTGRLGTFGIDLAAVEPGALHRVGQQLMRR